MQPAKPVAGTPKIPGFLRRTEFIEGTGFDEGRVKIDWPDGVRVTIEAGKAGDPVDDADDIDALIKKVPHAATP